MSAEIHVSEQELRAATIGVLEDAHRFVVEAVLTNVLIEGLDPNEHMTAARIRAAIDALGGDPSKLLDERRCSGDGGEWWREEEE